ncbi:MAG: hypothetical protein JRH20_31450, partial [Deltaproteobacteria bacterium]|nr:hypothetical protein [Deltaproteobacteria bacterium]
RPDAWGNGRVELRLDRDSLIAEKVRTIVVVDQRQQGEPGRTLRRFASCAMPAPEELLRRIGCGDERMVEAKVNRQRQLVASLEWSIGTTVLRRYEKVPEGEAAPRALEAALLSQRLFSKAISHARDEVEAYNLSQTLDKAPLVDFEVWLKERISALGFESGEDLELLAERDFAPALLTPEAKAALDARFPRSLSIAGQRLKVSYNAQRREITIKSKGNPPRMDLLPQWSGWRLFYDDGKKRVPLGTPR